MRHPRIVKASGTTFIQHFGTFTFTIHHHTASCAHFLTICETFQQCRCTFHSYDNDLSDNSDAIIKMTHGRTQDSIAIQPPCQPAHQFGHSLHCADVWASCCMSSQLAETRNLVPYKQSLKWSRIHALLTLMSQNHHAVAACSSAELSVSGYGFSTICLAMMHHFSSLHMPLYRFPP